MSMSLRKVFGRDSFQISFGLTMMVVLGSFIAIKATQTVCASAVPERPTVAVEHVKMFECTYMAGLIGRNCSSHIEDQANEWLEGVQPGTRIIDRRLAAGNDRLVLAIFYEVPR